MKETNKTMGDEAERRAELQARIWQYHGVSLEEVLNEIEYIRDCGDSVIGGGSLAYGLGNRLSDLDLVIAGPTTVESSRIPVEHFIDSLRVDVWKLSQRFIEETFARAEQALGDESALHGSFGNVDHENELKLLHRIAFGVIVDGDGLTLELERDYRELASNLVIREYAERMRGSALLAQLAARADRPVAAVINARLAVEEALNATIADRGLPFSGDKWLRERIANQTTDLAAVYEPFRQLPKDPTSGATRFVEEAIATCEEQCGLNLKIDALASAASWKNTDLQAAEIGEMRVLFSAQSGALWGLDESELEIWRHLVSATGAGEPEAMWSLDDCDEETLTLCLHLHEQGLLSLHWTHGVSIEDLAARRTVTA